jgi:hypothetical protein
MIRIYDGDNGELVYDEGQDSPSDPVPEVDEIAKTIVENSVTFFYDPGQSIIRAQFVYTRGGAKNHERVVVEYDAERTEVSLSEFRNAVGEVVRDDSFPAPSQCSTDRDQWIQESFLAMYDPDVNASEIDDALGGLSPDREHRTVAVPSMRRAVDVVGYLLEREQASVAIAFDGRNEFLDGVDVVVFPDAAAESVHLVEESDARPSGERPRAGREAADTGTTADPSTDEREGERGGRPRPTPGERSDAPKASDDGRSEPRTAEAESTPAEAETGESEPSDSADADSEGRSATAGAPSDRESKLPGPEIESNRYRGPTTESVLRIFDGPTGSLIYDSSDELPSDGEFAAATEAYKDGVVLYVDPHLGELFVYTNGRVGRANQQLVVQYSARPGADIVERFHAEFETVFDERNWSVLRDAGDRQTVFNELLDAERREPDVDEDEMTFLLDQNEPLDFGTPSVRSAIGFVRYLWSVESFDGSVAICTSGRPDELADTDVVVMPSTISFDAVEPRAETGEAVARARLEERFSNAREALSTLDARLRESSHTVVERQQILSDAIDHGDVDDWSVAFRPSKTLTQRSATVVALLPMVILLAAAVLWSVVSGTAGELVAQLQAPVTVSVLPSFLPVTVPSFRALTLPSGVLFFVGLAAVGAAGLLAYGSISGTAALPTLGAGATLSRFNHHSVGDANPRLQPELGEFRESLAAADDLLDEVDTSYLEANADFGAAVSNDPAEVVVEQKLRGVVDDLDVVDRDRFDRDRKRWILTGLGGGLLGGALLVGGLVGVTLGLLTYWQPVVKLLWTVTRALFVVALAAALVETGRRLVRVAWSVRPTRGRRTTASRAGSKPPESAEGGDEAERERPNPETTDRGDDGETARSADVNVSENVQTAATGRAGAERTASTGPLVTVGLVAGVLFLFGALLVVVLLFGGSLEATFGVFGRSVQTYWIAVGSGVTGFLTILAVVVAKTD